MDPVIDKRVNLHTTAIGREKDIIPGLYAKSLNTSGKGISCAEKVKPSLRIERKSEALTARLTNVIKRRRC